MFPQLPSNLDMLAAGGVLGFDAESYIYGTPARYWGAPQQNLPMETPLPVRPYNGNTGYNGVMGYGPAPNGMYPPGYAQAMLPPQPTQDVFGKKNTQPKTATWKKVLAGVTGALLLGVGLFKLKGGKFKQLPTQIKEGDATTKFTNIKNTVVNWITNMYNKITKKTPPQPPQ